MLSLLQHWLPVIYVSGIFTQPWLCICVYSLLLHFFIWILKCIWMFTFPSTSISPPPPLPSCNLGFAMPATQSLSLSGFPTFNSRHWAGLHQKEMFKWGSEIFRKDYFKASHTDAKQIDFKSEKWPNPCHFQAGQKLEEKRHIIT